MSGLSAAGRFTWGSGRVAGRLLVAAWLAVAADGARAEGRIVLDAPDEISPLLEKYLPALKGDQSQLLARFNDRIALTRRTRREAESLLATEGYFAPSVTLEKAEDGDWRLVVDPGPRATVGAVNLGLREGALEADEAARQLEELRRRWTLASGAPFTQSAWDAGKAALLADLTRHEFAAARISSSLAKVNPEAATVDLQIEVDPGPRFRFGRVEVRGLDLYDADLVQRYRPPEPGTPYDEDELLEFQTRLQNTPYFASAVVEIDREPDAAAATPIRVLVGEAKPKRLSLGAGFSSNNGYRAEIAYRDADLFGKAWQLVSGLRIEQRELLAYADVFLPPDPAGYQDSFGALHERSDHEGLKVSGEAFGVTRTYPWQRGEVSVSIRYQRERTTPDGAEPTTQKALTGDLAVLWREVDNVLEPRQGFVAFGRVGGAAKAVLSTQNFVRSYGRLQVYLPVAERDVLTLRGEFGKTVATSRDGIPQDFLFRAGGSQSVRGYGYRSLGVSDGDAVVGGRYLATMSAEYTRWRPDGFGYAAFVDAGNAVDDANEYRPLLGYGIGGRWKSPAGPLALDLAYGQDERRFRLHFAILVAF
ncbi:MAG: outer membrane protein assembly factor [Rhodocyclaceae bacterium]|nr:outer membrane protein assembly factor [Rhodocyclaceae bacterium]